MTIRPRRANSSLRELITAALWVTASLSFVCSWQVAAQDDPPLVPIGHALSDRDGDTIPDFIGRTVRVRGTVTVPTGIISDAYLQAFIQDDTGGIYLFDRKVDRDLAIGDVVEAVGQVDQYRGAIQLVHPRYEVVARRDPPAARPCSVREAASWNSYGRLVRVTGIIGESESATAIVLPLRSLSGEPSAKIDVFVPRKVERGLADDGHPPGATVSVVGVVSMRAFDRPYLEGFELIVRSPSDIEVLRRPAPPWMNHALVGLVVAALAAFVVILANVAWRRRVERRERQLALVNELSAIVVSPHHDREQLLDAAVKLIRERTAAKAAAIQLLGANDEVTLARWDGLRDEDAHLLRNETIAGAHDPRARTPGIMALEQRGYHLAARLPIAGRSRALGMLTVFSATGIARPETITILSTAAGIVGLGLENAAMARESEQRQAELRQLAITDDLTGLYNRRFLEEYLRIQLAMAHRQREPVAFITLDLDGFNAVNEEYGHATGDRILARVGEILRIAARTSDLPVRLGGEEFLVAMPQTDADGARVFAERLLETLADTDFSHIERAATLRITASAGVSAFPEHGDRIRTLLRRADEALSQAKSDGRNAVRVARG